MKYYVLSVEDKKGKNLAKIVISTKELPVVKYLNKNYPTWHLFTFVNLINGKLNNSKVWPKWLKPFKGRKLWELLT